MHRRNVVELEIRNCKSHSISGLSFKDPYFPIRKWGRLLSQCLITLILIRNSRVNPSLSVYAYLDGPYDFKKYPMLSPGTCVIVHGKPVNRKSLLYHVTQGWYIGPSLDHYIFIYCYMPLTGIVRITDTLQYIPNTFAFQKTTTEYYLQQAIGYIIANIKEPPKTRTFLSYRYAKKCDES